MVWRCLVGCRYALWVLFHSEGKCRWRWHGCARLRSLFAGQGKKALSDPVVTAIASEHDKSPAQVLGRWCVQKGLIYLPKSAKEARMIENAAVFDFELTVQNLAALDALTSQDSIDAFAALYRKCVVRDTPLEGTGEGIKADVTSD